MQCNWTSDIQVKSSLAKGIIYLTNVTKPYYVPQIILCMKDAMMSKILMNLHLVERKR